MRWMVICVVTSWGYVGVVSAQEAGSSPSNPPKTEIPSAGQTAPRPAPESVEKVLDQGRASQPPIAPAASDNDVIQRADWQDVLEGTSQNHLLWPEDYHLSRQRGSLKIENDQYYFVPVVEPGATARPPLHLLPNTKLMRMMAHAQTEGTAVEFVANGEVTVYRDENYLLLSEVAVVHEDRSVSSPKPGAMQPANSDSSSQAADILESMKEDSTLSVPLPETQESPRNDQARSGAAGGRSVHSFLETSAPLPEGTRLVDRMGRIEHEVGWWTFAFESDSRTPNETPLRILPNQALQAMQTMSAGGLRQAVFRVSGEITEFEGQDYLLVRRFILKRDGGNLK